MRKSLYQHVALAVERSPIDDPRLCQSKELEMVSTNVMRYQGDMTLESDVVAT